MKLPPAGVLTDFKILPYKEATNAQLGVGEPAEKQKEEYHHEKNVPTRRGGPAAARWRWRWKVLKVDTQAR